MLEIKGEDESSSKNKEDCEKARTWKSYFEEHFNKLIHPRWTKYGVVSLGITPYVAILFCQTSIVNFLLLNIVVQETVHSAKPALNLAKQVEEDTPKSSSKRKHISANQKIEEYTPKTSFKRKCTPEKQKVSTSNMFYVSICIGH